jgi:hypothetical protein
LGMPFADRAKKAAAAAPSNGGPSEKAASIS